MMRAGMRAARRTATATARPSSAPALGRRTFIFSTGYSLAKKMVPKISATEQAALDGGTVGFDRDIFSGSVSLSSLKAKYSVALTAEEQAFMDNEVEQLCEMISDYQITRDRDLPPEVWAFIRSRGFLGMMIPKEYGGLGFSAHGHSQVVMKIASRSGSAAVTVMVPNSLGPGELLMKHGTQAQRDYFLPRLASGEIIPCFGLTGAHSGSDAAGSMRDEGVVVERDGRLGIVATFSKRYITLAPVAGVVGLAFNLKDPNGLLRGRGTEGITLALLERGHEGLRIGPRHDPLTASFMNGTVQGEDVFIDIDQVIGGQEKAGTGWSMLMACLAEGRAISLPALGVAASKGVAASVGAYAKVRKQFKVPLSDLEGVQEHLARVAGNAYVAMATQHFVNAMLNQHEQPAVLSAATKATMTNRMRDTVNDGMDVLGGAGICQGPANFLGAAYTSVPIAITVEGANTLTRSLIVFGQGLNRSHPHVLDIVKSVHAGDDLDGFRAHTLKLVAHAATNAARSAVLGVARRRGRGSGSAADVIAYHESQLNRLAANFALLSDATLAMGGKLKFAEFISGRMADVFCNLYMGYATLWFHAQQGGVPGAHKVLDHALSKLLVESQEAMDGVLRNLPVPMLGGAVAQIVFPLGRTPYAPPADALTRDVAQALVAPGPLRELFKENMFVSSQDPMDRIATLERALPVCTRADEVLKTLRRERRQPTEQEQALIDEAEALRDVIVQVDSFERLGREIDMPASWTASDRPAYDALAGDGVSGTA